MQEWGELLDKLKDVTLGWRKIVIWKLERSGHFTTTSLYRWMSFKGMKNKRAEKIWRSKFPMKLKVFLWLTIQDRLPTKTKMKERKWKVGQGCAICSHALWHVSPRHASKKPLAGIEYQQTRGTSPRFGSRWGWWSTNTNCSLLLSFSGGFGMWGTSVLLRGFSQNHHLNLCIKSYPTCRDGVWRWRSMTARSWTDNCSRCRAGWGASHVGQETWR